MHIYPLGDSALVLEIGTRIDEPTHFLVQRLWRQIEAAKVPGVIEVVPAYTSVTIYYEPRQLTEDASPDKALALLEERVLAAARSTPHLAETRRGRTVEIPVCYGGEFGPDLEWVAEHTELSPEAVWRMHCSTEYLVYLLGFAPGFPFLGGLPVALRIPRRTKPRAQVPAGSVAIAGEQSGIYPIVTPGGWHLIGRTPLKLFRVSDDSPTLLRPGDRVRFIPIAREDFLRRQEATC